MRVSTTGGVSSHGALSGVTSDQHHAQLHAADHAAGGGDAVIITHAQTTGQTADQHHAQAHAAAQHNAAALPGGNNESLGAAYLDIAQIATPANPAGGTRRLFVDSADGVIKVRTSGGVSTSLEGGGGGPAQATQAAMEAETVEATYVSPDRARFHPGAAKGWCSITNVGALESPDHNVDSVTDTGVGDRTIVWTDDFSSAVYTVHPNIGTAGPINRQAWYSARAVGSVRLTCGSNAALADEPNSIVAFGDQ